MPIYEYVCKSCGAETELMQKLSDPPATSCPVCGKKKALVKSISAAGFRLSGGGWYETDFKSGSKKNLAGEAGAGDAAGKEGAAKESAPKESKEPATASKDKSGEKAAATGKSGEKPAAAAKPGSASKPAAAA